MSAQKKWPVKGYWIGFNTKTHTGLVGLQMDNDANPDIKLENLPADELAALAAILMRGGADYYENGAVLIKI